MAEVKINRELLTDLLDALDAAHGEGCCKPHRPCPTAQRIARGRGVLRRAEEWTLTDPRATLAQEVRAGLHDQPHP